MPRSHGIQVQNKFIKGLITEATALSFPEDACTETYNCVFDHIGRVSRRLGIDQEGGRATVNLDLTGAAIVSYQWKNVGGDGDLQYVVVQIGNTLHFYLVSAGDPLSTNKHANTIDLTTFLASGVTTVVNIECQFAQGNGYLFVTNPNLDPFYISYNSGTNTFSATRITLQARDFVGVSDSLQDQERPTTLTEQHRYNLANQGWPSRYRGTSATSITIGTGSKVFTTQSTLGILVGDRVRVYSSATPGSLGASTNTGNIMIGTVTAYAGTSLTVNVTATNGAGTLTDWNIVEEPDYTDAWPILYGNYPNNCDVWWSYKNTSGVFAPSTEFANSFPGLGRAPRGHFILSVFNEDRAGVSGLSTLTAVTTGSARPATCAFFAGRVFYSGIQFQGYNARIYFSQILSDISQAGKCYQLNDPTAEEAFDLLPSDGGFVDILEAGSILKLVPVLNGLMVIATNGIWHITGSQGTGFVATDYTIHKISAVPSASACSLVEVDGLPIWWTYDGIFTVQPDQQTGQLNVRNLIEGTILSFYQDIPLEGRRFARGTYDPEDHKVQWIFKSVQSTSVADKYVFDRMLTLNLLSGAFYPWSVTATQGRIHSVVAVRSLGGAGAIANVSAASGVNNVQSGGGTNQVIAFVEGPSAITGNSGTIIKYLCSNVNGANTPVTFAECYQTSYLDWGTIATGIDYSSYFITGYRVHGQAMRKFQTNYVDFFSDVESSDTQFMVRSIWDWSSSAQSGKWSTLQAMSNFYRNRPRRIKLRGHGRSVQFQVQSVTGQPFNIIGWAAFETANQWI